MLITYPERQVSILSPTSCLTKLKCQPCIQCILFLCPFATPFGPGVPWLLWGREDMFPLLASAEKVGSPGGPASCSHSPCLSPLGVVHLAPPETHLREQCILLGRSGLSELRKVLPCPTNGTCPYKHNSRTK